MMNWTNISTEAILGFQYIRLACSECCTACCVSGFKISHAQNAVTLVKLWLCPVSKGHTTCILQVLRDTLQSMTTVVKQHTASLRGLELDSCKEDRDLRCLPSLRRLVIHRAVVQQASDQKVYRLPAGLVCLAVVGEGIAYLDASSCSKDLLIVAEPNLCLQFVGQNGCNKGACQRRVMRLDPEKMKAWVSKTLVRDTEYHKW